MKIFNCQIGTSCNNNCVFCFHYFDSRYFLPFSDIQDMLLQKRKEGFDAVFLLGGEPTIYNDLFKVLELTKKLGYKEVRLVSNGRMYSNMDFLKKLIKYDIKNFSVSIHAHDEKLNYKLMRSKGAFAQTYKGLKNLIQLKHKGLINNVGTHTVVCKANKDHLRDIYFMLKRIGVDDILFGLVKVFESRKAMFPKISDFVEDIKDLEIKYDCFPLCLLLDRLEKTNEYLNNKEFMQIENFMKLKESVEIGWKEKRFMEKTKMKPCEDCVLYDFCGGVWTSYYNMYGDSEFRTVALDDISHKLDFNR